MFVREERFGVVFYQSDLLLRHGVPHAFSTRLGGVSPPPFDSLNLGNPSGIAAPDIDAHVAENYRRLHRAADLETHRRVWGFQCHGARVVEVCPDTQIGAECRADGLATSLPGVALAVRYADCVPVLFANASTRRVAAVHAGWRGASQGILDHAVAALGPPADTLAAIGPCIGPTAFEVGEEVLAAFSATAIGRPAARPSPIDSRWLLDLSAAVRGLLECAGVEPRHIDESRLCTFGRGEEFFSERRDGRSTGRQAALVGIPLRQAAGSLKSHPWKSGI